MKTMGQMKGMSTNRRDLNMRERKRSEKKMGKKAERLQKKENRRMKEIKSIEKMQKRKQAG